MKYFVYAISLIFNILAWAITGGALYAFAAGFMVAIIYCSLAYEDII